MNGDKINDYHVRFFWSSIEINILGIKGYVVNVVDYDEIHIGIEL